MPTFPALEMKFYNRAELGDPGVFWTLYWIVRGDTLLIIPDVPSISKAYTLSKMGSKLVSKHLSRWVPRAIDEWSNLHTSTENILCNAWISLHVPHHLQRLAFTWHVGRRVELASFPSRSILLNIPVKYSKMGIDGQFWKTMPKSRSLSAAAVGPSERAPKGFHSEEP